MTEIKPVLTTESRSKTLRQNLDIIVELWAPWKGRIRRTDGQLKAVVTGRLRGGDHKDAAARAFLVTPDADVPDSARHTRVIYTGILYEVYMLGWMAGRQRFTPRQQCKPISVHRPQFMTPTDIDADLWFHRLDIDTTLWFHLTDIDTDLWFRLTRTNKKPLERRPKQTIHRTLIRQPSQKPALLQNKY